MVALVIVDAATAVVVVVVVVFFVGGGDEVNAIVFVVVVVIDVFGVYVYDTEMIEQSIVVLRRQCNWPLVDRRFFPRADRRNRCVCDCD